MISLEGKTSKYQSKSVEYYSDNILAVRVVFTSLVHC